MNASATDALFPRAILIAVLIVQFRPVHAQTAVQAWVQRYNGPGNGDESASAIAVDRSGNVFVTGSSLRTDGYSEYATIKYSNEGVPAWTNRYYDIGPTGGGSIAPTAIAIDSNGNVLVTGGHGTVKYSNGGLPLWTNVQDSAKALASDVNGNVFVVGYSWNGINYDIVTMAYSGMGAANWTGRYEGGCCTSLANEVAAVVVDSGGNVFTSGRSPDADGIFNFETVGYSNTGMPRWTNRYDFPSWHGGSYVNALALDGSGNVVVTGYSYFTNSAYSYATIKYSNAGVPLWTNRYHIQGNHDRAQAIAVDASGNIFVTGISTDLSIRSVYATVAYSTSGVPLWTNLYYGPGNGDLAQAISVDSSGNVVVTGYSYGMSSASDYASVAYSATGVPLWTNRYNAANGEDRAVAIAADNKGNVFVTGFSQASHVLPYNSDWATIKYAGSAPEPVRLAYQMLNNQLVLTWTNAGFGLQSASTVVGLFTNVASATSPYTNNLIGPQQYFRLISN
jgi:hypothetical protein